MNSQETITSCATAAPNTDWLKKYLGGRESSKIKDTIYQVVAPGSVDPANYLTVHAACKIVIE